MPGIGNRPQTAKQLDTASSAAASTGRDVGTSVQKKMATFIFVAIMSGLIILALQDPAMSLLSGGGGNPGGQDREEMLATEMKMLQQIHILEAKLKQSNGNVEYLENQMESEREHFVSDQTNNTDIQHQDLHHMGAGVLAEELAITKNWLQESQEKNKVLQAQLNQIKERLEACEAK